MRYATAIALARQYHVWNAVVAQALQRLEVLEAVVGTVQMAAYMRHVPGLQYSPGMFSGG